MSLVRKVAVDPENVQNGIVVDGEHDEKFCLPTDDAISLLKTIKNESVVEQVTFDKFYELKLKVLGARSPVSNYMCKVTWILKFTVLCCSL